MAALLICAVQEAAPSFGLPEWLEFAGRLHPLALHMPIGLLAAVLLAELVSHGREGAAPLRRALYVAFGLSAAVAAFTGWRLGNEDGYASAAVDAHRKLGIAAAALALVLMALALFGRSRALGAARVVGLAACAALFMVTGHHGGTMTHGARFLSSKAPDWLAPWLGPAESPRGDGVRIAVGGDDASGLPGADVPGEAAGEAIGGKVGDTPPEDASIAPGIEPPADPAFALAVEATLGQCVECHGPEKSKGRLRLDGVEGWLGTIDLGSPEFSEFLYRVELPADDPDAMPPEGDPRFAPEHTAAIRAWIGRGAPAAELAAELARGSEFEGK